jgi:hypothetical protein
LKARQSVTRRGGPAGLAQKTPEAFERLTLNALIAIRLEKLNLSASFSARFCSTGREFNKHAAEKLQCASQP